MGPTGTPSQIPEGQNVLIAGGGTGNAVLLSVAQALKEKNNKVFYFAGYRKNEDVFDKDIIESSSDKVFWCSEEGEIPVTRDSDSFFKGNIIEGLKNFANSHIKEFKVTRILTAGSPEMMKSVKEARKTFLKEYLPGHDAIANVNSPMQCMMKEVCGQCLQRDVDPATGKEKYVFSCNCQEQNLDEVDFQNLDERLEMNRPIEKLNRLYFECFVK